MNLGAKLLLFFELHKMGKIDYLVTYSAILEITCVLGIIFL